MGRLEALQILTACREADAIFHSNEDEKNYRKFEEKKELKNFHSEQIVSNNNDNNNKHSLFTINLINYVIYLPKGRELKK